MVGYRDTQFETSEVYSGERTAEFTNPRFIYPTRVVRIAAGGDDIGPIRGPVVPRTVAVPLKAGFMRNISTGYGTGGDLPRTKLQFQFNPQDIQQEVMSRQDMYLSVLQDPAQLSQPVAGNSNFRFDLLFDRTMEVKNGGRRGAVLDDPPGVFPGEPGPGDSSDIGVLADLQVMYAIIGQGMNNQTVSEQSARVKELTLREFQRATASQDPFFNEINGFDKTIKSDEPILYKKKDFEKLYNEAFKDFSNVNMGNAAFLVPMPMRIIFSSLYMVDGYVTKSSVVFTKFSTNLVPIQCRVMLEVNAVYMGFARDTTFLTQSVDKSAASERQARIATKEEVNNFIKEYATKYLATLNVNFSGDPTRANPFLAPSGFLGSFGDLYTNPTAAAFAGKGEWWAPTTNDNPNISVSFISTEDRQNTKIADYYKDGGVVNIDQNVKVEVYGPYDSKTLAEKDTSLSANKLGFYSQANFVNSKDAWQNGYYVFNNTPLNGKNASNGALTPDNQLSEEEFAALLALNKRPIEFLNNEYADKWFKFVVKATVSISGAEATSGSKTVEQTFYEQGDNSMKDKTISLKFDWTKTTTSNTNTSGVSLTPNSYDYLTKSSFQ